MIRSFERPWKRALAAVLRILLRQTPPPIPPSFGRILIIRQHNQLGDMLCVVPLLRALAERYPACRLTLLTSPVNHDIMLHHRYLDEVIKFDKARFFRRGIFHLFRLAGYIRALRRRGFEAVIVPSTVSSSFTSDLLGYLSGAPVRIGAESIDGKTNPSSFFFTHPAVLDWRREPHRHQTLRNLDIAQCLGLAATNLSISMTLLDEEEREGRRYVSEAKGGRRKAIALHPGAGKMPNRWPLDRFVDVAKALSDEFDAEVFVTVGPMDEDLVESLCTLLEGRVQLIQNQAVRRVASILSKMDLVISNDTGIMHVAAAVGAPVLALFGPTDPGQWAPIGSRIRYIQGKEGIIESISRGEVLEAARTLLVSTAD